MFILCVCAKPIDLISDGIDIEPVWLINPTAGGIYLPLLNPFL